MTFTDRLVRFTNGATIKMVKKYMTLIISGVQCSPWLWVDFVKDSKRHLHPFLLFRKCRFFFSNKVFSIFTAAVVIWTFYKICVIFSKPKKEWYRNKNEFKFRSHRTRKLKHPNNSVYRQTYNESTATKKCWIQEKYKWQKFKEWEWTDSIVCKQ